MSFGNVSSWLIETRSEDVSRARRSIPRARWRRMPPTLPGRSRRSSSSVSAARAPIVSTPAALNRASERGPMPGQLADVERGQKRSLASRRHDDQTARLAEIAGDLADDLARRDADGARQARRAADRCLHRFGERTGLPEVRCNLAQVEVTLVLPRALDGRNDLADGLPDRLRVLGVEAVARPDEDGMRAAAQRLGAAHRRVNPELAGLVVGGRHDAPAVRVAADDERLRAQLGILQLLDGGEEGIQIEVA